MDLRWALGRPCGPQVPQKVDFLDPFGSLWPPFGRPVAPFGPPWGSFLGRLCINNRVFLPCDVQAHLLPHFRMFFRVFWEHFGSVLGGVGVPNRCRSGKVVIYANLGISYVKLRFAWVGAIGNVTPQGPKSVQKRLPRRGPSFGVLLAPFMGHFWSLLGTFWSPLPPKVPPKTLPEPTGNFASLWSALVSAPERPWSPKAGTPYPPRVGQG